MERLGGAELGADRLQLFIEPGEIVAGGGREPMVEILHNAAVGAAGKFEREGVFGAAAEEGAGLRQGEVSGDFAKRPSRLAGGEKVARLREGRVGEAQGGLLCCGGVVARRGGVKGKL